MLSEKGLEILLRNLFKTHPKRAYSLAMLLKRFKKSDEKTLRMVLKKLEKEKFVLRYRYGMISIWFLNPLKQKWKPWI